MKETIITFLAQHTKLGKKELATLIEIPPKPELGDYALPCYTLAKKEKKAPAQIAEELSNKLNHKLPKELRKINATGAYLNLFINQTLFAQQVLKQANNKTYGNNNHGKGKKVVIDMSSPNIAKPFGIGHLRSTIIGNALANLANANGYEVVKLNYLGDWGTQFGKMIYAYKQWGKKQKLEKNPIKHLYDLYIKGNNKTYEDAARAEFKQLEQQEPENVKLWKTFKQFSQQKFNEIYDLLGITFDATEGESDYNTHMDSVIQAALKKNIAKKDDGAIIVDLKKEHLSVAVLQKQDGTSLYHTRDIAAAINRHQTYHFDHMIYEVGQEQTLYFKQLFRILELLGHSWAKKLVHTGHGLYLDKDGKKFATRKGKTIFMEDILNDTIKKAEENLKIRGQGTITKQELKRRAHIIAIAAIFYGDLQVHHQSDVIFDPDKFLSFEGNTGPYLLYSYARANTLLNKNKSKKKATIIDIQPQELKLLKTIEQYPNTTHKSYKELSPNIIANYAYQLAKHFNEFYHECPVLGSPNEGFRIKLTQTFANTLQKTLNLLGIPTLKEM